MDEVEYKLKTHNSVIIVNAIDKLISTIKSKFKPDERQKFVLENEELKFLRDKCSSTDGVVSLTACQGLLALVELGVLEIAHTMSTVVTLLPTTHNYSAIISTMAGLLVLDLKSRLNPNQQYKCQFSLRSPQHPFITVLEKNKDVEDDILVQMQALCNHPDYNIASNSLELLQSVFLWMTCSPHRHGVRPWQLLLSLPQTNAQSTLLLTCISCQQICKPKQIEQAYLAYSAVCDAAIYQQRRDHVTAFLPMLARVSTELLKHGRDPRGCYNLIERCFVIDAPELKSVAGLTIMLLAKNLINTSALYLHELFNLCLNIINKYEYSTICLNSFVGLSLQWLHLPSYLTNNALQVASKLLDLQNQQKPQTEAYVANLKTNTIFQSLLYLDKDLFVYFKLLQTWEKLRNIPKKLNNWFESLTNACLNLKLELLPFFVGVAMSDYEELNIKAVQVMVDLVKARKEVAVTVLPVLMYKIANDKWPSVKLECLRSLPLMATSKENVPTLVSILNKLKASKGVPTSLLIMLYTSLAEAQVRCFPYLQELLVDTTVRPDELKWEIDVAKAVAVKRVCELRPSTNGLELVSTISSILNRCTDRSGATATSSALEALAYLWRGNAVAPPSTWRALEPRLGKDNRPLVQISLCKLLSEIPALRVLTPEYDKLITDATRKLWYYIAESNQPAVIEAACQALALYKIEDYKLKDIPEIYRRTVKLPPSHCKTPADAARRPEDVLDYVPCEIWPEVFKYTNQAALSSVEHLVTRLMEREISGYRSGVYQQPREPQVLNHMPVASVYRGVMEGFRRQATSPSYDYPEPVLLSIFSTLTSEYSKPLPPLDLCFLHELFHRGSAWKAGSVKLAARQAKISLSGRRLVENFLEHVIPDTSEETDIELFFDNLIIFCWTMPPNNIRPPLERCLADSFSQSIKKKVKNPEDLLFVKQLRKVKECLESDKIHDANRTLLSQIVENYFSIIDDDHVAWPIYIETCRNLSSKYLERMTSPSGWWEVSGALLRKTVSVRSQIAAVTDIAASLVWLNEAIDAHAGSVTELDYSLRCMLPALKAAKIEEQSTRDWFLQLLARTQVAFKESEEEFSKLYLCDVFFLSVIAFSGHWAFEPNAEALATSRTIKQALFPAAAAALVTRDKWGECTLQLLEWLCHTRDIIREPSTSRCCQRALLALRHTEHFSNQKIWTRIETNNEAYGSLS